MVLVGWQKSAEVAGKTKERPLWRKIAEAQQREKYIVEDVRKRKDRFAKERKPVEE